jgi:hypothetical protein
MDKLEFLQQRMMKITAGLSNERKARVKKFFDFIRSKPKQSGEEWEKDFSENNKYRKLIPQGGLELSGSDRGMYHIKLHPKDKDLALFWFYMGNKPIFYIDNHEPPVYGRAKSYRKMKKG